MGQVDRLTSCAPGYLNSAVPRSGPSKSRKTPSPPCYLTSTTSHTGTLCTLCSGVSKYKTTGRDAESFTVARISRINSPSKNVIGCSYPEVLHSCLGLHGSGAELPGGATYILGQTLMGFTAISGYWGYPPQKTKRLRQKVKPTVKNGIMLFVGEKYCPCSSRWFKYVLWIGL